MKKIPLLIAESFADLRSRQGEFNEVVLLTGGAAIGDANSGWFRWDLSSVTADDSVAVIAPEVDGVDIPRGRWLRNLTTPSELAAVFAEPPTIGGTTPGIGTFTTLKGTTVDGSLGSVTPAAVVCTTLNPTGRTAYTGDVLATLAGTGISAVANAIYKQSVSRKGTLITTSIMIDLTGLDSSATGDIIGKAATANCHIGQITAAVNGTILGVRMTCLEAPLTGEPDIHLGSADEATGAEDAAFSGLTNGVTLIDPAANWTAGLTKAAGVPPVANQYLYLIAGAADNATYSAGKFLIELFGYDA